MSTSSPSLAPSPTTPSDDAVVALTRAWLEQAVIGLNLCPFAKSVHVKNQVRYHVSRQQDWNDLSVELEQELSFLAKADPEQVDTTLFILPLA